MLAIQLNQTGGPDVLQAVETATPTPGSGEILIRNQAIALNFIETYLRKGLYPLSLPSGLGSEGAGIVDAVGPDVTDFVAGDRVVYYGGDPGAYAELYVAKTDAVLKLPDAVTFETAAAAFMKGLTTWALLHHCPGVKPGDVILVHAAAGGVGTIMTQWAKVLGCTVIATVGSEAKAGVARANGADHVILYDREDVAARVKEITGGRGVRVSYDSVGAATVDASLNSLARRGWYVSFGNASGPVPAIEPLRLMRGGSLVLTRPTLLDFIATRADFEAAASAVFAVIASGQVKIQIGQRFALKDAAEAHRAMESRATIGASLLLP